MVVLGEVTERVSFLDVLRRRGKGSRNKVRRFDDMMMVITFSQYDDGDDVLTI